MSPNTPQLLISFWPTCTLYCEEKLSLNGQERLGIFRTTGYKTRRLTRRRTENKQTTNKQTNTRAGTQTRVRALRTPLLLHPRRTDAGTRSAPPAGVHVLQHVSTVLHITLFFCIFVYIYFGSKAMTFKHFYMWYKSKQINVNNK